MCRAGVMRRAPPPSPRRGPTRLWPPAGEAGRRSSRAEARGRRRGGRGPRPPGAAPARWGRLGVGGGGVGLGGLGGRLERVGVVGRGLLDRDVLHLVDRSLGHRLLDETVVGLRGLEAPGQRLLGDGLLDLAVLDHQLRRRLAGDVHGAGPLERLVAVEPAEARAGQRRVGAAAAVAEDRRAASAGLLLRVGAVGLLGGELGLGLDVDAPAGQPRGQARVLALAPDGQRELVVGDHDGGLAGVVVDEHLAHARGRERLGHEAGGLIVVRDDVDLLAAQLGDDHAHARATRAHAGTDRVHTVGVGDDGDLRAVAGLARDVGDLDQAVGDLGDLELEELLDELGIAPRDDDRRALGRGRDLLDDRLDALGVVVALAVDLLGLGQQRLDALAQLDQRVARVGLLDDAGDELADAVAVLLEHHVALRLADALQDDLLGGLGGDAAEVVRGDVLLVDLVAVLLELGRVDLGVLRLYRLAGLGIDVGPLVDRLDDQVGLQALGHDELDDAVVAGVGVHLHARVLGRARLLLVRRQQGVLQRMDEAVGRDALLDGQGLHGVQDLSRHVGYSSTRLDLRMSAYGIAIRVGGVVFTAIVTSASVAPTSSPVKDEWPSWASRRRTRARRPRKRRKWSGLVSGRVPPGEDTSSA